MVDVYVCLDPHTLSYPPCCDTALAASGFAHVGTLKVCSAWTLFGEEALKLEKRSDAARSFEKVQGKVPQYTNCNEMAPEADAAAALVALQKENPEAKLPFPQS